MVMTGHGVADPLPNGVKRRVHGLLKALARRGGLRDDVPPVVELVVEHPLLALPLLLLLLC